MGKATCNLWVLFDTGHFMEATNGLAAGWNSGQTYFSSLNQTSEGTMRQIIWISLHVEMEQEVAW